MEKTISSFPGQNMQQEMGSLLAGDIAISDKDIKCSRDHALGDGLA